MIRLKIKKIMKNLMIYYKNLNKLILTIHKTEKYLIFNKLLIFKILIIILQITILIRI
jgi:hypothetical protein